MKDSWVKFSEIQVCAAPKGIRAPGVNAATARTVYDYFRGTAG